VKGRDASKLLSRTPEACRENSRGKRVKRAQPLETGPKDNGALEGRQDASPQLLFVEFDVA